MWITNPDKFKNLIGKYLELKSDIILNDETFDENGNPSGGDGVVFSWSMSPNLIQSYFCGNDHTIYGAYINEETLTDAGIFSEHIREVVNVKIDNVYMNVGGKVAGFIYGSAGIMDNVHVLGGTIKSIGKDISGVGFASTMRNVSNKANLIQTGDIRVSMGGISGVNTGSIKIMEHCYNYGNLYVKSNAYYIGGLLNRGDGIVRNCANYGEIICEDVVNPTGIGGILGMAGVVEIRNCSNYANLMALKKAYYAGAILGYATGKTLIDGCENYGKLTLYASILGGGYMAPYTLRNCDNYGDGIEDNNAFINTASYLDKIENCNNYGNIYRDYGWASLIITNVNCKTEIINCGFYGNVVSNSVTSGWLCAGFVSNTRGERLIVDGLTIKANLIGPKGYVYLMPTPQKEMIVSNSTFEINIPDSSNVDVLFCGQLNQAGQSVKLNNIQVNLKTNRKTSLRIIQFGTREDTTLHLENILINEECGNISSEPEIYRVPHSKLLSKDLYINGIVRTTKTPTTTYQQYYGNDFSGYVSSWKTGQLQLKALSGRDFYQSKVTEEILKNRGYEKKVI